MRAKLLAMTTETPAALIEIGACSRLEPQPKFSSATRMSPALDLADEPRVEVLHAVLGELGGIARVEIASRDDDVGVDVAPVLCAVPVNFKSCLLRSRAGRVRIVATALRTATLRGLAWFVRISLMDSGSGTLAAKHPPAMTRGTLRAACGAPSCDRLGIAALSHVRTERM